MVMFSRRRVHGSDLSLDTGMVSLMWPTTLLLTSIVGSRNWRASFLSGTFSCRDISQDSCSGTWRVHPTLEQLHFKHSEENLWYQSVFEIYVG